MKDFHCYGCQKLFGKPNKDGGYTSLLCDECRETQSKIGEVAFMKKAHDEVKKTKSLAATRLNEVEKSSIEIVLDTPEKIKGFNFGLTGDQNIVVFRPRSDFYVGEKSFNRLMNRLSKGAHVFNGMMYGIFGQVSRRSVIRGVGL